MGRKKEIEFRAWTNLGIKESNPLLHFFSTFPKVKIKEKRFKSRPEPSRTRIGIVRSLTIRKGVASIASTLDSSAFGFNSIANPSGLLLHLLHPTLLK